MLVLIRIAEAAIYILLLLIGARGLMQSTAGDLTFAGLCLPLMVAFSWRLRAAGVFDRPRD